MKSQKKAQLTVLALLVFAGSLALGDTQVQANEGSNAVKSVTMHRLYNPFTMEHFYTASSHERDVLVGRGWKYEGVGWYAPEKSNTPVYRLYNPFVNDHHYTTSSHERDVLSQKYGWIDEGIGWYSDDAKTVPLYRRYCPFLKTGSHHYTTGYVEAQHLTSIGWKDEGIAWYGTKSSGDDNYADRVPKVEFEEGGTLSPSPSADTGDQTYSVETTNGNTSVLGHYQQDGADQQEQLVNAYRNQLGLNSLTRDPQLDAAATIRAREIAVQMSHTRPNGSQWYSLASANENIWCGVADSQRAFDDFKASPDHNDTMTDAGATKCGYAFFYRKDNYLGTTYYTRFCVQLIS
uniref:CAP domain-containing protein n=1 Tax=Eubacterium cellulosolvens TaxID=29322 RepID=UPI0009DD35C0|nr:CAP domain-containing protein [[Eubacterium] cellulosolvens]